jgi:hypothetical protein
MDLFNFVKTTVNPEIAAQMASSIAWRIDTMLQQQSRELLKELKPQLVHMGIDEYNDLEASIASAAMGEFMSIEGGGERGGCIHIIQSLNPIRDVWHKLAKDLTNLTFDKDGIGREYDTPDLDDVFFTPIELKVKAETIRRTVKRTQRNAVAYQLDEEQTAARVKKAIARKEEKAADTSRYLTDQQPTVNTLFRLASSTALPYDLSTEFDELPNKVKLALLSTARDSAMRLAEWADDYFWLSEDEYDGICNTAIKVDKALMSQIIYLNKTTETN